MVNAPIRIPTNYLKPAQSAGEITRTLCDWSCSLLIEKLAREFQANH